MVKRIQDQFTELEDAGKRLRERRKARGICIRCGKLIPEVNYTTCKKCLTYLKYARENAIKK